MLPTFLIIGAPRSGTTFLFCSLASHPRIGVAREIELHYFDESYDRGLAWYQSYFSHCNANQVIGEKTASYFIVPGCAEKIRQTLDTVKLIVVLRNPIERAYSHYRRWVAGRTVALGTSFRDCLRIHPQILVMGNYYDHLMRYLDYFSIDEMLVLFSDDLFRDPSRELGNALRFLGLDGDHGLDTATGYNRTPKVFRLGGYVLPQRVARLLEKRVPGSPLRKLRNLVEYQFEPLDQEDRDFLEEYYGSQNEKLFKLLSSLNIVTSDVPGARGWLPLVARD